MNSNNKYQHKTPNFFRVKNKTLPKDIQIEELKAFNIFKKKEIEEVSKWKLMLKEKAKGYDFNKNEQRSETLKLKKSQKSQKSIRKDSLESGKRKLYNTYLKGTGKANNYYNYYNYIKSLLWSNRRELYFLNFEKKCTKCYTTSDIQLHHVKYGEYDGNEQDFDLSPLCDTCHKQFHEKHGVHKDMHKIYKHWLTVITSKELGLVP